jgi:aspartyl protease family protein
VNAASPRVLALALLLGAGSAAPSAAQDVSVEALLPGMAVLTVDGRRHTLRAGERVGTLRLVSADARAAVVEIDGQRHALGVSDRISSAFAPAAAPTVTVTRNERMQYRTQARINGRVVEVLIDTGANVVAMSRDHADGLGIDPTAGELTRVETAGAMIPGRTVMLRSVSLGAIRVDNVRATIIEGSLPSTVLLGMSFLRHVELEERDGVLSLTARF